MRHLQPRQGKREGAAPNPKWALRFFLHTVVPKPTQAYLGESITRKTPLHCRGKQPPLAYLDEIDAPLIGCSGVAGHVADDPTPQGHEGAIPVQPFPESLVPDEADHLQRLVLLPIREDHHLHLQP